MSALNETRFIVQHESYKWKCELNESVCNLQQKWNPSTCDCECNKACKIDEHLDTKNNIKRLIGKLVLRCEDKILNTTETSPDDKKGTCEENDCLIHIIFLVIICLLLVVVISITFYYYYTRN